MDNKVISGEELAWRRLISSDTKTICKNAMANYSEKDHSYLLKSFGEDLMICPSTRQIKGLTEKADYLLNKLSFFYKLSILWYLIESKDIALTKKLVNPKNLKGGDIFFKGSHVLPLDKIANRYKDKYSFIARADYLAGKVVEGGDIAVELYPFTRIPVRLILWLADEEFDATAELLFDSSCEIQLPLDVIWSIAIFTINAMTIN